MKDVQKIRSVFCEALDKETPEQREAYLAQACQDDPDCRADVEVLLQTHSQADDFFRHPIIGTDIPEHKLSEEPGTVIDRYKLLERIGEGGMAVVYMAEQEQPVRRRVALKIIKLGMDTRQVIARFEAERQALALMYHPHIAKVLYAGTTETGRPYFVMELVQGRSITEYCDQNNLSTKERLDLFIQSCNAVQHAHQKGIIHRDIKPSNVMVTMHDGKPMPKIIDFGIAKATNQRLTEKTLFTRYAHIIGTPAYMSPEQAELSDRDVDTRSDIYSLGILLYELLTGTTPFSEEELRKVGYIEMTRIIRKQEPLRPSTRLTQMQLKSPHQIKNQKLEIANDLDWIVMKSLDKERTRRYDTASALALDVARHLSNEPVIARPPSALYQLHKAWRRNKVIYAAGCMVVASLVIGISLSLWQARIAKEGEHKQRLTAYASDMRVAQEHLREYNLGKVLELLNRYLPRPGQKDLRGIAWRYLWQASKGDEIHTFTHESMVRNISLCANGTRLASLSMSGKIRLFDVDSRRLLREQDGGSKLHQAQSVALSPDGQLLAADEQGTLRVRNADNGKLILEQKHVVAPLSFSPDARYLAGVTEAGLRIWNTTDWTGRLLGEPLVIKVTQFRSLTFTPDSSRVILSPTRFASKSKVMVYNLSDDTAEGELTGLDGPCGISTDGSIVAAGAWDGHVCVWDLATQNVIKKFKAHTGLVFAVALSPDGKTLATGGNDQVIRLWDMKTFENTRTLKGHRNEIWSLSFSGNGRILASSSKDHSVKLWQWNLQADSERNCLVPENLYCRGYSESGDVLRFYDPNEWLQFPTWGEILPPEERPSDFGLPRSRTDHLLDLGTGKWTHVGRSDSEAIAQATSMIWKSGQDTELFGKADGTVVLSDGTTTRSIQVASHPVQPLLLSPKGRYLLSNVLPKHADPYAILWDIETQGVAAKLTMIKTNGEDRPAISPDERFLAYDGDEYEDKLWQIPEKRELATLQGHTWRFSGFEFSPDSRLLATCSWDGDCLLWDVEKGDKANPHFFRGHRSGVGRASFSPDGRTVATSSEDGSFKLWSVATGQELLSLPFPLGFPWSHWPHIMAAEADRLVWAGYPEGHPLRGQTDHIPIRVTTLPSLAEIDEEIRRQSSGESSRDRDNEDK